MHVTEQQKIQFLSLAATSGKYYLVDFYLYSILIVVESQFPIEMNPLKVLVSVIHDTESIHKTKEALTKEVQSEFSGFLLIT